MLSKGQQINARGKLLHLAEPLEASQEPAVDVGHLVDLVDTVSALKGGRDRKKTLVGRPADLLIDVLDVVVLVRDGGEESVPSRWLCMTGSHSRC